MEPTQEYGWRMLKVGEVIKDGDEYFDGHQWCKRDCHGTAQGGHLWYKTRRKIDPGEGWELVLANEIGSTCFLDDGSFEHTFDGVEWWRTWNKDFIFPTGRPGGTEKALAFRRRIQPQSEWLDIKTVKPKIGDSIWWVHPTMGVLLSNYSAGGWQQLATHWRPVKPGEIPEAPKPVEPVKTQEEIDREDSENWYSEASQSSTDADELCEQALRTAYEAGLRAGRAK
jgi:hypothetical protein